jgi:glycolate dehydrogenase iron-sulfur subunit
MQTQLAETVLATASGRRADEILRACVHCGFCNATCPTYLLTGDELDGPRGRIYLIKDMLETAAPTPIARDHLDRCLTCRACETTCPSGVAYGELAEIGRSFIEAREPRGIVQRLIRGWLVRVVPIPRRLSWFARLGRLFRWSLPDHLARAVPRIRTLRPEPQKNHARRVVLLDGCVQRVTTPEVNAALARVLDAADIKATRANGEGCCGSLELHLSQDERARTTMRANVEALYAAASDAEAIVSTASGCGVTIKDYGRLLADDPQVADRARWVSEHTVDAAEYLARIDAPLIKADAAMTVAWHPPCTLQHGQRVNGVVEGLLQRAGYRLVPVASPHLCCGSAGTYSVLQHTLGDALRAQKLAALTASKPDVIATANVGCQLHLREGTDIPVRHWLELLG